MRVGKIDIKKGDWLMLGGSIFLMLTLPWSIIRNSILGTFTPLDMALGSMASFLGTTFFFIFLTFKRGDKIEELERELESCRDKKAKIEEPKEELIIKEIEKLYWSAILVASLGYIFLITLAFMFFFILKNIYFCLTLISTFIIALNLLILYEINKAEKAIKKMKEMEE